MPDSATSFLHRENGTSLAYFRLEGESPGLMFLGGFRSDMSGTKASALEAHCRKVGRAYVRFDYGGHGESSGKFEDGTIGEWAGDALAILNDVAQGPQVLVGSSMGAWMMLLAALARPERVKGLVGVASGPDFTAGFKKHRLTEELKAELDERGYILHPPNIWEEPYPITKKLLDEGDSHLLLRGEIDVACPVRLIHGMTDETISWEVSLKLSNLLKSDDVRLTLVKDGGHRLSRDADIELIIRIAEELADEVG
ncbi:MAG: alpha/beta hydrolase [Nitrospinae bacterium]|nr:alpha/beta hydrolase [Nitrospinota bacterium]